MQKNLSLTNNQIAGLLEVEAGTVRQTPSFKIQSDFVAPTIIGRLEKMGLIEWRKTELSPVAILTPKGEAVLKQHVAQ